MEGFMDKNILVTYASTYGATKEIAEKIGGVLLQAGLQVEILPVKDVKDVTSYKAVILGAALYVGKWHKKAEEFIKNFEKDLAARQVWLFSSGPTGEGDPLELVDGQALPGYLQPLANHIRPLDITVFHGNIDPQKVNFMEKFAIKSIVKKPFGDYRDWDMISAWAVNVANALKQG
jgi:menaquinone-dependent protoporphyrinogen oxidase